MSEKKESLSFFLKIIYDAMNLSLVIGYSVLWTGVWVPLKNPVPQCDDISRWGSLICNSMGSWEQRPPEWDQGPYKSHENYCSLLSTLWAYNGSLQPRKRCSPELNHAGTLILNCEKFVVYKPPRLRYLLQQPNWAKTSKLPWLRQMFLEINI